MKTNAIRTLLVFLIYGNLLICADGFKRNNKISYHQRHFFVKLDSNMREMSGKLYGSHQSLHISDGTLSLEEIITDESGIIGIFGYENITTSQTDSFFAGVEIGKNTKLWKLRHVGILCSDSRKMEDGLNIYLDDDLRFHPQWTPSTDFLNEVDRKSFGIAETEAFYIVNWRSSVQFHANDTTVQIRPHSLNVNLIVAQYTSTTVKVDENGFFVIMIKHRTGEPIQLVYVSRIDSKDKLLSKLKNYLRSPQTNLEENIVFNSISNTTTLQALASLSQTVIKTTENKHLKLAEIVTIFAEGTQRLAIFSSSNSKQPETYLVAFRPIQAQAKLGNAENYAIQYLSKGISDSMRHASVKEFTDNPYAFLPTSWVNLTPVGAMPFQNLTNIVRNLLVLTYAATEIALVKFIPLSGEGQIYACYTFNISGRPACVGVVAQKKILQSRDFRSISTRQLRRSDSAATTLLPQEVGGEVWTLLFLSDKMEETDSNLGAALNRYRQDRSKGRAVGEWIQKADMVENIVMRFQNCCAKLASIFVSASVKDFEIVKMKTISSDGKHFIVVYSLFSEDQQVRYFFASISIPNTITTIPDLEILRYVSEPIEDLLISENEAQAYLDSPVGFVNVVENNPQLAAHKEEKVKTELLNFLRWRTELVSLDQQKKLNFLDDQTDEIYTFKVGREQDYGYVFVVVEMPYSSITYVSPVVDENSLELSFLRYNKKKPTYLEEWILPDSLTPMATDIIKNIEEDVVREEAETNSKTWEDNDEEKEPPVETNKPPTNVKIELAAIRSSSSDGMKKVAVYRKLGEGPKTGWFYVDLKIEADGVNIKVSDEFYDFGKLEQTLEDFKIYKSEI